jgi:antitoxin component of RelBE/YafQ-DinJ toxin-antitoxin module
MLYSLHESDAPARDRRLRSGAKASVACETLEGRQLLSGGLGLLGGGGGLGRGAEMASLGGWRQDGMFGGGSVGLGGGMRNPSLFLTAPLLVSSTGTATPPSPSVFSSSAVQTAMQTLQTDLKNDIPSGARPTHASVGQLEDDLEAIHKGTLTGTAAQTKIQTDQAAILSSMGLTQAQISQIQTDQQALETAIQSASSSSSSSTSSTSSTTTSTSGSSSSGSMSAVRTAFQTLETALQSDTPSGATATHESVGQVEDDLDAIRKGTLTGSAAVTQVQTDATAVLSSMGLTTTQISAIQADQQAVATALQSAMTSNSTTTSSSSSSTTQSTLQSVSQYLVGLPGLSMMGFGGQNGMSSGWSGPRGGFGFNPGGPMMMWR